MVWSGRRGWRGAVSNIGRRLTGRLGMASKRQERVGSGLKWTALEAMVGGLCRGQRRYIKDWFLEDFLSC